MKKLLFLAISSLSAFSSLTHAGYERGNGGNFLLCDRQSVVGEGVFSLDRIEGERIAGKLASEHFSHLSTEDEIVNHVLTKISTVSPFRAAMYQEWYKETLSKIAFLDNMQIQPLNDGDVVLIPEGCSLKQGAIFVTDPKQKNIQFYFDRSLWQKASALDRSYLILHELIYREARLPENNHANSMASRKLTSWIFQNIDKLTQDLMLQKIEEVGFRLAEYQGVTLSLTFFGRRGHFKAPILKFPETNRIWKAALYHSFSLDLGADGLFQRRCSAEPNENGYFMDWVEFYPSGQVKQIVISQPYFYNPSSCSFYKGNNFLQFDAMGRLREVSLIDTPLLSYFE